MRLTDLEILNFRGIKESNISFPFDSRIICLIGAGDSTKSTILKAIEWVFWPSWNLMVTDADFYNGDTTNPIIIRGTITDFPDAFLAEDKYGLYLRSPRVKIENGINDEPRDGAHLCLTVQLVVDSLLEPQWEIVCNRLEPRGISQADRKQLFIGTIGNNVSKDLAWGRYSVLQKYADSKGILHEAYTEVVRESVRNADLRELNSISGTLTEVGKRYGVFFGDEINSRLMLQGGAYTSSVGLYDGDVPLSQYGTGSQRLLSMGLNISAAPGKALLLIDEIENGLEPFRLRNLINELRSEDDSASQIIMTTHSSVALAELTIDEIMVAHSSCGKTRVLYLKGNDPEVNKHLQAQIRSNSEAFLSRRLIVCEGRTEVGFIRAFDRFLADTEKIRMAYKGVSAADGHGESIFQCAYILKDCGYDICILMDSDKNSDDIKKQKMKETGVPIFEWDKPNAIEEQCFIELPLPAIQDAIQFAANENGCATITGKLTAEGIPFYEENGHIEVGELSLEQRKTLGTAAKKKGWYKRIGLGEEFASIVLSNLDALETESTIRKVVTGLTEWVMQDDKTGA